MKMWENFFKKINKPVPVFAQTTKMEKEISSEDSSSSKPKTTFCDVAGLEEVKEELFEIVDFMKFPDKYKKMGAKYQKVYYFMVLLVQVKHYLHQQLLVKQILHSLMLLDLSLSKNMLV